MGGWRALLSSGDKPGFQQGAGVMVELYRLGLHGLGLQRRGDFADRPIRRTGYGRVTETRLDLHP